MWILSINKETTNLDIRQVDNVLLFFPSGHNTTPCVVAKWSAVVRGLGTTIYSMPNR